MGRCLRITVERWTPCLCLGGHVKEPDEMSRPLGAWPLAKLLLQSAYTSMCRHIYNWSIVECGVKAKVSVILPMETAAIFFSREPLSKTGYWLGVCHGWFHLHWHPRSIRSESENYKMKNSCPQRDSNSRPFDCEATTSVNGRPRGPRHYRRVKT